MADQNYHREQLIHVLHMAYSGELAAGLAYAAHWRSVRKAEEKAEIQHIEEQEWEHRAIVGSMLKELAATPQKLREVMMWTIGKTVGTACFLIGWFLPMYFAGRLESANIKEYEHAAFHAEQIGLVEFSQELMRLAAVESEHEQFFLNKVHNHPWLPFIMLIFKWGAVNQQEGVAATEADD